MDTLKAGQCNRPPQMTVALDSCTIQLLAQEINVQQEITANGVAFLELCKDGVKVQLEVCKLSDGTIKYTPSDGSAVITGSIVDVIAAGFVHPDNVPNNIPPRNWEYLILNPGDSFTPMNTTSVSWLVEGEPGPNGQFNFSGGAKIMDLNNNTSRNIPNGHSSLFSSEIFLDTDKKITAGTSRIIITFTQ